MAQKKATTVRKSGTKKKAAKKTGSRTTKKASAKKAGSKKKTSTRGSTRKTTSSKKKTGTTPRKQATAVVEPAAASTAAGADSQVDVLEALEDVLAIAAAPEREAWEAAEPSTSLLEMESAAMVDVESELDHAAEDLEVVEEVEDADDIDVEIVVEAEKRVTEQELGLLREVNRPVAVRPARDPENDVPDLPELRVILSGVLGSEEPTPTERRIMLWLSAAFAIGLFFGLVIGWVV